MRFFALIYGVLAFAAGVAVSSYQICFVGNFVVPKTVDHGGTSANITLALLVNTLLLSIFGLQHSLMARSWFKKWWTRAIPQPIERSTYVFAVLVAYGLLFWQWQPIPTIIWAVENTVITWLIYAVFACGWLLVIWSSQLINPREVWGLQQTVNYFLRVESKDPDYKVSGPYRYSRHPIMLGLMIAFWAAPVMTLGHMQFALIMTAYALLATIWEERDLIRNFPSYAEYRKSTSMLFPWPGKSYRGRNIPEFPSDYN
jgi:methanethiol S-methyltransferase